MKTGTAIAIVGAVVVAGGGVVYYLITRQEEPGAAGQALISDAGGAVQPPDVGTSTAGGLIADSGGRAVGAAGKEATAAFKPVADLKDKFRKYGSALSAAKAVAPTTTMATARKAASALAGATAKVKHLDAADKERIRRAAAGLAAAKGSVVSDGAEKARVGRVAGMLAGAWKNPTANRPGAHRAGRRVA